MGWIFVGFFVVSVREEVMRQDFENQMNENRPTPGGGADPIIGRVSVIMQVPKEIRNRSLDAKVSSWGMKRE